MKIKVGFLNKRLFKDYLSFLSVLSVFVTLTSFTISIPANYKLKVAIGLLSIYLIIYIFLWLKANLLKSAILNVNNSKVEVKIGDIFEEQGLKVIPFNEYFDTQVDNVIISENSLNGIYINKMRVDVIELDKLIEEDELLKTKIFEKNRHRKRGKQNKYKLGTIYKHNDFLLTAFSKFDNENKAYLYIQDYINFLLNFWKEVDVIYSGRTVTVPLMGSGITRFKEYDISDQELLELLIWSLKISRIKFAYQSKLAIVIHESKKDNINFYKLKDSVY